MEVDEEGMAGFCLVSLCIFKEESKYPSLS